MPTRKCTLRTRFRDAKSIALRWQNPFLGLLSPRGCGTGTASKMPSGRIGVFLAGGILLLLATLSPFEAVAQGTGAGQSGIGQDGARTVATYEDWTLRCGQNANSQTEICYMVQQVSSKETQKPVLQIAIGYFGPERREIALITLPLGVRLPPGLALQVTGQEPHKRPFERCVAIGCQAQLPLDDVTIGEMKAGLDGRILFQDRSGRTVALPFSLKGFTAAYNGLK